MALQGGSVVHVTRTTYDNNTSVTSVLGNGNTTTFTSAADYQGLVQALKQPSAPTTRAGLSYRYVKTSTSSRYFGPEYKSYSLIVKGVSNWIPAPLKYADKIAAAILAGSGTDASYPTWVKCTSDHYEASDSTEYFLGYYKINYLAKVYRNSSYSGTPVSSDSDTFESLSIL